jgi:hypothetical protein
MHLKLPSQSEQDNKQGDSMVKQVAVFLFLSVMIFSSIDCKKNPVAPPPPPNSNDTTSNNFTFQTFTFGGNSGSCVLSDVAIISPTDIWAVGAVYLDSADGAPDPFPYNAVHWDGQNWNLQKVPYNYQGQAFYSSINSILAFNSNDIWFEAGIHWDGNQFNTVPLNISFPSHANKMWGSSSNDFYIVGNSGLIAHYNGSSWTQIATGISLSFNDIYGSGGQILAVCIQFLPAGGEIFSIQGNTATQISSNPIGQHQFLSVWFVPNQQYYIVGDGIYQKNSLSDNTWNNGPLDFTNYGTTKVRGNGINDVFVVGAFGELLHWNGVRGKSFIDQTGLPNGSYASIAVKGDLVVAVGGNGTQGAITVGKRQ